VINPVFFVAVSRSILLMEEDKSTQSIVQGQLTAWSATNALVFILGEWCLRILVAVVAWRWSAQFLTCGYRRAKSYAR
jgi:hypothetical protein